MTVHVSKITHAMAIAGMILVTEGCGSVGKTVLQSGSRAVGKAGGRLAVSYGDDVAESAFRASFRLSDPAITTDVRLIQEALRRSGTHPELEALIAKQGHEFEAILGKTTFKPLDRFNVVDEAANTTSEQGVKLTTTTSGRTISANLTPDGRLAGHATEAKLFEDAALRHLDDAIATPATARSVNTAAFEKAFAGMQGLEQRLTRVELAAGHTEAAAFRLAKMNVEIARFAELGEQVGFKSSFGGEVVESVAPEALKGSRILVDVRLARTDVQQLAASYSTSGLTGSSRYVIRRVDVSTLTATDALKPIFIEESTRLVLREVGRTISSQDTEGGSKPSYIYIVQPVS